jgi:hypothetical protein
LKPRAASSSPRMAGALVCDFESGQAGNPGNDEGLTRFARFKSLGIPNARHHPFTPDRCPGGRKSRPGDTAADGRDIRTQPCRLRSMAPLFGGSPRFATNRILPVLFYRSHPPAIYFLLNSYFMKEVREKTAISFAWEGISDSRGQLRCRRSAECESKTNAKVQRKPAARWGYAADGVSIPLSRGADLSSSRCLFATRTGGITRPAIQTHGAGTPGHPFPRVYRGPSAPSRRAMRKCVAGSHARRGGW